jgi:RNA 2',3'-cyclic 3'-phosphodiesterase
VSSAASVEGRERVRLFLGLPLPDEAVRRLVGWQRSELESRSDVRLVAPENLHVTLAFLGTRPVGDVEPVASVMREAAAESDGPLVLTPARYRETRSVGMIVFDDVGGRATTLATTLWDRLERLGVYEREHRSWLAHVTVVRFRTRPRATPAPPAFGRVSPSEVALYHSVLRRTGAQYEILESVALGGSTH